MFITSQSKKGAELNQSVFFVSVIYTPLPGMLMYTTPNTILTKMLHG